MTKKYLFEVDKTNRGVEQKLRFEVVETATRSVFGREDVRISPVAGHGEAWVQKETLLPYGQNS